MKDCALSVEELSKRYPRAGGFRRFPALSGVSFELDRGEILGFLGPNGAGKTTTIKCILGLLRPDSGVLAVFGSPPASPAVRARLGYVPENPDYDDSFTPLEYLSVFASMRGIRHSDEASRALLGRVGLSGWGGTRLRRLSKGMKQRLSLALALQSRPDLLVMDEPTGGLDPGARKEFRDIILEENGRGASIFLSSHILSEVETVCDRAVILSSGRVVASGSLDELLRSEDLWRIAYTRGGTAGSESVHRAGLQDRIDALRASGAEIEEVARHFRSLEDVFLTATEGAAR